MNATHDSPKCARLLKANKRLVQQERTVREALRAVMAWWMATPQFEAGEDEMPAHVFDKAMTALQSGDGKQAEHGERYGLKGEALRDAVLGQAPGEWPSKGLL